LIDTGTTKMVPIEFPFDPLPVTTTGAYDPERPGVREVFPIGMCGPFVVIMTAESASAPMVTGAHPPSDTSDRLSGSLSSSLACGSDGSDRDP
jgi:hypothetical protein